MRSKPRLRATVDRIERDEEGRPVAVLVFDDGQQLVVPGTTLPAGAQPGDVLDLLLQMDRDETSRRAEEIRRLQQQLYGDES